MVVDNVQSGGPSAGKLKEGDVFVTVNGTAVTTVEELRGAIGKAKPGQTVQMVVRAGQDHGARDGDHRSSDRRPEPGRRRHRPAHGLHSEVTVDIKLDDVGGPAPG